MGLGLPCLAKYSHHAETQCQGGIPAEALATWNEVGLLLPWECRYATLLSTKKNHGRIVKTTCRAKHSQHFQNKLKRQDGSCNIIFRVHAAFLSLGKASSQRTFLGVDNDNDHSFSQLSVHQALTFPRPAFFVFLCRPRAT